MAGCVELSWSTVAVCVCVWSCDPIADRMRVRVFTSHVCVCEDVSMIGLAAARRSHNSYVFYGTRTRVFRCRPASPECIHTIIGTHAVAKDDAPRHWSDDFGWCWRWWRWWYLTYAVRPGVLYGYVGIGRCCGHFRCSGHVCVGLFVCVQV